MARSGNVIMKNSWKPAYAGLGAGRLGRPQMGMSMDQKQNMGIAVLSALSIAGLHSAVCPSYFTMKTFASQPEARERAMEGLWISLGLSTLASVSLYFIFDEWLPAIVSQATALALFGISVKAVNSPPPETIPPIEKQEVIKETVPATRANASVYA
jgi:hypothetical protein